MACEGYNHDSHVDDGVGGVRCALFAFRQFHNHLMILAFRSTMDGSSDVDEPPQPDFLALHAATAPPPHPSGPPQNPSSALLPFAFTLLPPLTEPTELFESPKHCTCDPVSELSFLMIDLVENDKQQTRSMCGGRRSFINAIR